MDMEYVLKIKNFFFVFPCSILLNIIPGWKDSCEWINPKKPFDMLINVWGLHFS